MKGGVGRGVKADCLQSKVNYKQTLTLVLLSRSSDTSWSCIGCKRHGGEREGGGEAR